MEKMSHHNRLPLSKRNHKPCFVFLDAAICCMLDLIDLHGIHYKIPFMSRNRIMYIVLHDQLVLFDHSLLPFFLLGCFFIAGRICINDVTQQCHITGVCSRPLTFSRSPTWSTILLCILNDLSCPSWSSLVGDCKRSFLQVKFSCMIRNI